MTTFEAIDGRRVGHRFYLVMSIVMAATIVAGFSQTVPDRLFRTTSRSTPGYRCCYTCTERSLRSGFFCQ